MWGLFEFRYPVEAGFGASVRKVLEKYGGCNPQQRLRFHRSGIYVAPSEIDANMLGLYTLILRVPGEMIDSFKGKYIKNTTSS